MKLIKYLKPFTFPLIGAIILLFIQAQADLALPGFMSNIVNVGIQQSGFEENTPEILDKDSFEKIKIFLDSNSKKEIEKDYKLITVNDLEYNKYKEIYPKIDNEIFILNENKEKMDYINDSIAMIYGINEMFDKNKTYEINGFKITSKKSLYTFLNGMEFEKINGIMNEKFDEFKDLKESIIYQSTINFTKNKYEDFGRDISKIQTNYILKIGLVMIIITIVGAAASIIVGFISAKIAAGVARNLRVKTFGKISSFSNKEFDKFGAASLITRSTNDINQIQNLLVIVIRMLFYAPLLGLGGVLKVLNTNSNMAWIIALAVSIIIIAILIIFIIATKKFKLVQKLVDRLNLVTRENLSGLLVIRAFNTEKFEEKRFEKANKELTENSLFINRLMASLHPLMMFIMNATTLLIVWVGAKEIANSTMQIGTMMAFIQYGMQILMSFLMLSMMFILIPRASVSATRISEILETNEVIKDKEKTKSTKKLKGNITFENVEFKYENAEEAMLKNLNFKAESGKTTAIIGSTGSGKTTVLNLIPRFYDVTGGNIYIDNVNIKDIKQKDLRNLIGYVPQKTFLFSGTIEDNVKFANKKISDDKMIEAIRISHAKELISDSDNKYQKEVSQKGSNFSGGQKQRLAIARAIAKDPLIYLFDDSFSALDFKTDKKIRKELKKVTKDKTILIIAQRISTIKNADQIIVLDDGKIVGIGKHKELINNCKTYKEIAYSQLSKEELA